MKAVVLGQGDFVEVLDVPEAKIEHPRDVVVRVTAAAICGSDIKAKHHLVTGIEPGAIIGHEFVGVVKEVGSDVTRFKPGDRVGTIPAFSCGVCPACRLGVPQNCDLLSMYGGGPIYGPMGNDGTQAELVRVPLADMALTVLPDSVPDEEAVLVFDMLSTGYHAAYEAHIQTGDAVAVSGCGPVGLCAILAAWQFGPSRVFAIDMYDNRLEVAKRFGATPIDLRAGGAVEQIMAATGGTGVDSVLEASGNAGAFLKATGMIAKLGSVACVGLYTEPVELPIHELILRGIRVAMSFGNLSHVPRLMRLVEQRRVDLRPLVTHSFALDDAVEAYDLFEHHKDQCLKVLLRP
jgi:alcohol dehydrogenase